VNRLLLLVILVVTSLPTLIRAEVSIESSRWQLPVGRPTKPVWHDVSAWLLPPNGSVAAAPRLELRLRNAAGKADEAMLLRYIVTARLVPIVGGGEGVWAIPFILEDRRVPTIRAGETRPVPAGLNRAVLGAYLKRMARAGYWPDALRLQVMLEPRPGESTLQGRIHESVLPVLWKQQAAGTAPAGEAKGGGPR
jgi:hypothetical protein